MARRDVGGGHLPAELGGAPHAALAVVEGPHALQVATRPRQAVLDLRRRAVAMRDGLLLLGEAFELDDLLDDLLDRSRVPDRADRSAASATAGRCRTGCGARRSWPCRANVTYGPARAPLWGFDHKSAKSNAERYPLLGREDLTPSCKAFCGPAHGRRGRIVARARVLSGRMARLPPVVGWDSSADLAVPARPRRERAQSVAEAARLRDEGLLLREIGARMGVSPKTVHAWLSDPEGSKARERKQRYRAICVACGGPCYRQGRYGEALRCETCERTHRHEQRTVDQAQGQGGARSLGRRSRPTADRRGDRPSRHAGSLPGDPARVRQLQQRAERPPACP